MVGRIYGAVRWVNSHVGLTKRSFRLGSALPAKLSELGIFSDGRRKAIEMGSVS